MGKRITVVLDDDAADLLLQLAGGPRRQGEFLSNLIRGLAMNKSTPTRAEFEAPRLKVSDLANELHRLRDTTIAGEQC